MDISLDTHAVVRNNAETSHVPFTHFPPVVTSCNTTQHIRKKETLYSTLEENYIVILENIEEKILDIEFGKDFLDLTLKAQATKVKTDKL